MAIWCFSGCSWPCFVDAVWHLRSLVSEDLEDRDAVLVYWRRGCDFFSPAAVSSSASSSTSARSPLGARPCAQIRGGTRLAAASALDS